MVNGEFVVPEPRSDIAAPEKGGAFYLAAKRVFDICFSLAVCVILAIPVAVICVAIAIDSPGKPFFRQERIGLGGKKIRIFKLRTMVADAHISPEKYMTPESLPSGVVSKSSMTILESRRLVASFATRPWMSCRSSSTC